MRIIDRTTVIFTIAALVVDYVVALASAKLLINPIAAPIVGLFMVAAFGWTRRGRDILEVYIPAFVVAYFAYLGFAIYRASQTYAPSPTPGLHGWAAMQYHGGAWPLVLVVGIFFALIATTVIALPISMIRVSEPRRDPAADARMAEFLRSSTRR